MRRIQTQEDRQKSDKKKQLGLGVFLIIIMFGSIAGYAISIFRSDNQNTSTDGRDGPPYVFNANGLQISFLHSPNEARNVSVEGNLNIQNFVGQTVYIASDDDEALQEIASGVSLQSRVQRACYGPCENKDLPEKTCDDNLIVFTRSAESMIKSEKSCIFIEGDSLAIESFLYRFLNLI